jgi:hypothetical protein
MIMRDLSGQMGCGMREYRSASFSAACVLHSTIVPQISHCRMGAMRDAKDLRGSLRSLHTLPGVVFSAVALSSIVWESRQRCR